jgi:predicted MFS family arabinose efflux permease
MVTVAGYFLIPPPSVKPLPENKPTVDWVGGATITIALLVLLFALTEGNVVGWSTPWIPVLIVAAILMIGVFVLWQWYLEHKTTKSPLMKVSVFKSLRFSGAMLIMMFFFASFSSYLVFTTFFFQDYQGLSVIQTMLRFIPTGVVGLCTAFTTGFMLSRVRGDHLLFFGTLCVATSSLLFAVPIPPETTYWAWAFFAMILSVFGADTLYPTLTLFTAQSLPPEDQALGGALVNALAQVGRAIGLAISTAIQTAVTANREGVDVKEVGNSKEGSMKGNAAYLDGLRAANYTDFAYAVVAFLVVAVAFRGAGKVGSRK